MLQNLLQDILFLLFLAAGFFVLLKNRKARYGLIVRDDADKLIRDGTQVAGDDLRPQPRVGCANQ